MPEKNNNLEEKFRSLIETIDVANTLTEPLAESIENLLKISANELNSEEASVLIREGDEGGLRFLSAIGQVAGQLVDLHIPAGRGIAGFVFSSGQPVAIADVGEDESFYAEVDKMTGFTTQTILATPLRHKGEIIGVLEFVNRIGEPPYEAFSPEEMDKAAVFAEVISSLVNAYETAKLFSRFADKMFSDQASMNFSQVNEWLKNLRDSSEHKEMIDMAVLVREISNRGDSERKMCIEILESILKYSENKNETTFLNY